MTRESRSSRWAGTALASLVLLPLLQAQTFEVASVKPSDPNAREIRMQFTPGGGVRVVNGSLQQMIMLAYNMEKFQISGGPSWLVSARFDIVAKSSGEAPDAEIRRRLQLLLAERFKLSAKRGSKEAPVFALRIAKQGLKLKESSEGFDGITARPGHVVAERVGMKGLCAYLSGQLGRPVMDETKLTGTYAFTLDWTPDNGGGPLAAEKAGGDAAPEPAGPSLVTALQNQLGLKLESTKGPVGTIVIEHAEKPSEN